MGITKLLVMLSIIKKNKLFLNETNGKYLKTYLLNQKIKKKHVIKIIKILEKNKQVKKYLIYKKYISNFLNESYMMLSDTAIEYIGWKFQCFDNHMYF